VTQCSLVGHHNYFGRSFCLLFQGRRVSPILLHSHYISPSPNLLLVIQIPLFLYILFLLCSDSSFYPSFAACQIILCYYFIFLLFTLPLGKAFKGLLFPILFLQIFLLPPFGSLKVIVSPIHTALENGKLRGKYSLQCLHYSCWFI
jgi:hypothetical protein